MHACPHRATVDTEYRKSREQGAGGERAGRVEGTGWGAGYQACMGSTKHAGYLAQREVGTQTNKIKQATTRSAPECGVFVGLGPRQRRRSGVLGCHDQLASTMHDSPLGSSSHLVNSPASDQKAPSVRLT